jgi:hypothetical protein
MQKLKNSVLGHFALSAIIASALLLPPTIPGVLCSVRSSPSPRGNTERTISKTAALSQEQASDPLAGIDIKAKGAFTCDFNLPAEFPLNQVGPVIERDRMYMAERPGMLHKHIPLRIDETTGNLSSGGRYLFTTFEQARAYKRWVEEDFILDGTRFFDRPYFLNPDCHAWSVIGAHDFADIHKAQVIIRTERWHVPADNEPELLKQHWPGIRDEAEKRGLTSVWLLHNKQEQLVTLVYFADRIAPSNPFVPDFASLAALEFAPSLGRHFDQRGWVKTFDRTQWVLNIWFPFVSGDRGEPSLWPHSPPLPQPYCGDGVCEVSRGERYASCPGDCPPRCGDAVCQPGENTLNCPGDCRLK